MSAAEAISTSVIHAALGVGLGTTLEIIVPPFDASASIGVQVFEAAVQVALNGVAILLVGNRLADEDPTRGFAFSVGLVEAQPSLTQRLGHVSAEAKLRGSRLALRMVPQFQEVETPNQSN